MKYSKNIFRIIILSINIYFLNAQTFPGKIGVGLDGIGGIALEFPDVTKTASAWRNMANNADATTDAIGWPTEDFRVVFFDHRPYGAWAPPVDDPLRYVVDMSGTYKLSFTGQADLSSWSDAPIQFQNKQYSASENKTTVDIYFPSGGGPNQSQIGNYGFLMVNFANTNSGTGPGVKNIVLTRPDYQNNTPQIFRTAYLNAISPFSTMRFMDYLNTNNTNPTYPGITTWASRQQVNAARWSNGAPWEIVVALANYTGKDIWINIPVAADDNYITQLATLIKNSLRPDVNIYIEYSNEVWNGSFTQYDYNYSAVLNSPEDADIRASTTYDDRRRARRVAKRVIRCGQIFEQVFGITVASRTRIRPVFAWQIGGWLPWYDDVLTWINSSYGPPKNFIYGIASAPYFNDGLASGSATPQQVVTAMSTASDNNVSSIQTLAGYANQWEIKHLQYEGGPDNGGGSTTNLANRINANRLPEMKTAVIHNYKDNWFSSNANGSAPVGTNDVANYFVISGGGVSRYGCWGATEDLNYLSDLSNAPKYDALCVLTGMCGNEPSTALLTPANNDVVQMNNTVAITANASDPDGTVKKVEFFVGSILLGSDTIAPYSIDWTPDTTGITIVLAKAIDNDGKYKFDDPHIVEVVNSTDISDNNNEQKINISPIPAKNIVNIEFEKSLKKHINISIYDISGKIIYKKEENKINNKISIDVSGFAPGLYFLKIEGNEINKTSKIIIQ